MNIALSLVVALLIVLMVLCFLAYLVTQQDLKAIRAHLTAQDAPASPVNQRSAQVIRRERSAAHDKLVLLEAGLSTQPRDSLGPEEVTLYEEVRRTILACNAELKQVKDWMGLPFDLEWPEVQERLPQVTGLYRQAVSQEPVHDGAQEAAS